MRALLLFASVFFFAGCTLVHRPKGVDTSDDFNRATPGENWRSTGASYTIDHGALAIDHAHNHPLWLTSPIPRDAAIDVVGGV